MVNRQYTSLFLFLSIQFEIHLLFSSVSILSTDVLLFLFNFNCSIVVVRFVENTISWKVCQKYYDFRIITNKITGNTHGNLSTLKWFEQVSERNGSNTQIEIGESDFVDIISVRCHISVIFINQKHSTQN